MKWLIASDVHGLFYDKLIEAYKRENAERMLLLGDLFNNFFASNKTADYLNPLKDEIVCVRGNCDSDRAQDKLEFPMSDYTIIPLGERKIYATHGHIYSASYPPALDEGDILLHGHTHIAACDDMGDFYYLNPGSFSMPKSNSKAGYMTLEDGKFEWKTVSGEVYMKFDTNDLNK